MKVTDCYWEKANIDKTTVEIEIEQSDIFDDKALFDFEQHYEYVVVKVPMKMSGFNCGLSKMGYTMSEVQCKLSKEYREFDFEDRLIQRMLPHISFSKIEDKESLCALVNKITPGMFSTDRISLDPYFGLDIAAQRYKNWMSSAFSGGSAQFLSLKYDNNEVGFSMYKQEDGLVEMILGGIFEEFQSRGIGIMTPTRHLLYAKQTGEKLKKVSTTISSNNVPVWKIYNHFNFKVDSLYYVFIKHI